MSRQEIYQEIEQLFGFVPCFLKMLSDSSLEREWNLMKRIQSEEGPIPIKYRDLMGVAISEAMKCRYSLLFHTERAKINGATHAEIEAAIDFGKLSCSWSTTLNGLEINDDQFKKEMKKVSDYVQSRRAAEEELYASYRGSGCCS